MSIGIFDSGMGGITVLNEIRKKYPEIDIHFYADTARLPYGEKTKEEILRYSEEIVEFLLKKNVELIVIACNTATSLALDEIKNKIDTNIIGVIEAGVNGVINLKSKNVGLIATTATVKSNKYEKVLKNIDENISLYTQPCPLFVTTIESGEIKGENIDKLINQYVNNISKNIDTLILGCTHYSIIKSSIKNIYNNLNIVDPSVEIINIIEKRNLIKNKHENSSTNYYVSGEKQQFKNNLKKIFSIETDNIFEIKGE
ncbi:glutamate racemase [Streptobacillus felis]|uniref:Glutamate racemase n=1 Tax=Streptobacillus felis TaxID=1384509 RepID=A0A7Z0TBJ5_9FUSO|nr:glutamate racemase [Streptobacillus felis]NYV27428.1 glutamate racemase [Streptobacillus felis]